MRSTYSQLNGTASRRVLATRDTDWARSVARVLAGTGVRPNGVSVAGVAFALTAATVFVISPTWSPGGRAGLLLVAAACIQLRLLCNLLDGMLAVEEGLKTRTGEIYNDLPDRLADVLILVGAGYAARGSRRRRDARLGRGRCCACFTAYVRRARRLARPDAALHRPDGEAASDVHADGRHAARGGRNDARRAAAGDARSASPDRCAGSMVTAVAAHRAHRCARWRRDDRGGARVGVSARSAAPTVEWRCDPDATRQRIYFANHSSHLDFVVIWSALPPRLRRVARPVAGRDYWEHGAVRRYLAGRRVPRGADRPRQRRLRRRRRARARRSSAWRGEMGDRHSLIVFPEGTRSVNGEVGAFKSGLYHLSRARPDAELIPVYLENLNRILPKGEDAAGADAEPRRCSARRWPTGAGRRQGRVPRERARPR